MSEPTRPDIVSMGPGGESLVREAIRIVFYLNQARAATRDAARSAIERLSKAILVYRDPYLLKVCWYVELNRVRAGMARPGCRRGRRRLSQDR